MINKIQSNNEIKGQVFKAYLKKASGEKLTKTENALIEAWELLGKIQKKDDNGGIE